MNHLAASGRGIYKGYPFNIAPKWRGIKPQENPRLRSGSVRLNNFVFQNYSLTDLTPVWSDSGQAGA